MERTTDQPVVVPVEITEAKILNALLVDDDNVFAHRLGKALEDRGLKVETCATIERAGAVIRRGCLDILINDLRIGDDSGLELVKLCKEVSPNTKSLVLTG